MAAWVAGVDGCKAGWVVVLRDSARNAFAVRLVPDFAAVITLPEAPSVIAVDAPIGLLATASAGGRACEVLARQLLRARRAVAVTRILEPRRYLALLARQLP